MSNPEGRHEVTEYVKEESATGSSALNAPRKDRGVNYSFTHSCSAACARFKNIKTQLTVGIGTLLSGAAVALLFATRHSL